MSLLTLLSPKSEKMCSTLVDKTLNNALAVVGTTTGDNSKCLQYINKHVVRSKLSKLFDEHEVVRCSHNWKTDNDVVFLELEAYTKKNKKCTLDLRHRSLNEDIVFVV